MPNKQDQDVFLEKSKRLLDKSEQNMDSRDIDRLHTLRRQAIDAGLNSGNNTSWLVPAGGVTFLTCMVLLGILWWPLNPAVKQVPGMGDLDILVENESLEFFQNLDFYVWLEEEQSG